MLNGNAKGHARQWVRATIPVLAYASFVLNSPVAEGSEAGYTLPPRDQSLVGRMQTVRTRGSDTLSDIARQYNLGFDELRIANPEVDAWLPGEGTEVTLPSRYLLPDAPRRGMVLNLPEMRLYFYPRPRPGEKPRVITHPVSIGRQDWSTPVGLTRISRKVKDPAWYPPDSIREEHAADGDILPDRVPPGPDNPLGQFALRLAIPGYLIHGTNRPYGIGMQVTHGCIRMYPEDIEGLFGLVPVGEQVRILDAPIKLGWQADVLYLEVHPALKDKAGNRPSLTQPLIDAVADALGPRRDYRVDWRRVLRLAEKPDGIPQAIAEPTHSGRTKSTPHSEPSDLW